MLLAGRARFSSEAVSSLSEEKHLKLFGWGLLRGKRGKGVRKQGDVCVEN